MRREYLSRDEGKGKYRSKLKKGKLKTKRLLKITIFDEQEPSLQSVDRTKVARKSEVEEICIYQNLESGRH